MNLLEYSKAQILKFFAISIDVTMCDEKSGSIHMLLASKTVSKTTRMQAVVLAKDSNQRERRNASCDHKQWT